MLITLKSGLCRAFVKLRFGDDPLMAEVWCVFSTWIYCESSETSQFIRHKDTRCWRHVLEGVVSFGEYYLQGKGYYGDASKAKNEVILSDGWREKWTTLTDYFFDTLGTEEYVLIIFFLMFSLIDRLRISVCKSYISHNIFSPYGPLWLIIHVFPWMRGNERLQFPSSLYFRD